MRAMVFALILVGLQAGAVEEAKTAELPIREVGVFKDGHAFVLREGEMPVGEAGEVVLERLPQPLLGTFWPYSADASAPLEAVTAGRRPVASERRVGSLLEMLEANKGADVGVTEVEGGQYAATIVDVERASCAPVAFRAIEPTPLQAVNALPPAVDGKEGVVFLRTEAGVKVLAVSRIRDLVFKNDPKLAVPQDASQERLILKFAWPDGKPAASVKVGMMYVQKGIRWIPSYHVELDGAGQARVRFQATLLNDLGDMEDATVNLIVGVPSFAFTGKPDPMALQAAAVQVVGQMPADSSWQNASNYLSNAIVTQAPSPAMQQEPVATAAEAIADLGGARSEDLYTFTVKGVNLKCGERMALPIAEFTVPYEDLYRLEVPFNPPPEVEINSDPGIQERMARLLAEPKPLHVVRLKNASNAPLTTAPVLITEKGRIVAQSVMTYTPAGAQSDVELTTAVGIQVAREEAEKERIADATTLGRDTYQRINLAGSVRLVNRHPNPVTVEVSRLVLGRADTAGADGKCEQLNPYGAGRLETPEWWRWCSWPGWWHNLNGMGRITWKLSLEPGKSVDLPYEWHYFWR